MFCYAVRMVGIVFHIVSPVTYWPGCSESIVVSFVRVDYFALCLLRGCMISWISLSANKHHHDIHHYKPLK